MYVKCQIKQYVIASIEKTIIKDCSADADKGYVDKYTGNARIPCRRNDNYPKHEETFYGRLTALNNRKILTTCTIVVVTK